MKPPRFLSVEDVLLIYQDTIGSEGGLSGLRDAGLLESAVLLPQQRFGGRFLHVDLAAMAAAYLYHLTRNHPFLDGNKRVGVMAAYVFLDANHVRLTANEDELEQVVMDVAAGRISKDTLIRWFRLHAKARVR